jgi:hypothetical protein
MKPIMRQFIIAWVFGVLSSISFIWVIAEFILYLVKNENFNWISLIVLAVFFITTVVLMIKIMLRFLKVIN